MTTTQHPIWWKILCGSDPGIPPRAWTTQHNLDFIHLTSCLSASLYSSLKWLALSTIPNPSNSLYPLWSMSLLCNICCCCWRLRSAALIQPSSSCSPREASSLLFLLKADVLQLQWARNEPNVTALFHQASNPPVIVVFLKNRTRKVSATKSQNLN